MCPCRIFAGAVDFLEIDKNEGFAKIPLAIFENMMYNASSNEYTPAGVMEW